MGGALDRVRSSLPELAGLAPELGFLDLLESEERAQWISGWLEPRVLRPRIRQHLRRHALLLELDEVVALLSARLSDCLGAFSVPTESHGGDRGSMESTSRASCLRSREPADTLGMQLIACCRQAARQDAERAAGLRAVIATPRLLAVEALTGLTDAAACAWLSRLHEAPLHLRAPWQARMDAWDGAMLAGPASMTLEAMPVAPRTGARRT